ncbi:MAG: AAA family ATPase [Pseudohongiellaceae bacterium]
MYLDYFSLKRHPFRITPDPSLFYSGGTHGRGVVLDALIYGITSGEGILKVVGEVGSGKTMLCRMLEERLPADTVEIVYIANPNLTANEIVYAIAFELNLAVDSATDRLMVMQKLQEYLLQQHGNGVSVVVFVEEAQSMPIETLEEIRLLSNLETHRHKLMQIVLFGQPELDRKLQMKSIRQLRERITHSFDLQPLNTDSVSEYIRFRLQAAGCPWPHLFAPKAEKLLARASAGLTRRINILADKSLLAAYADPSTRPQPRNSSGYIQPMVLPRHVRAAIRDSGYGSGMFRMVKYAGLALASVVLVSMIAIFLFLGFTSGRQSPLPVTGSPQASPAPESRAVSSVPVGEPDSPPASVPQAIESDESPQEAVTVTASNQLASQGAEQAPVIQVDIAGNAQIAPEQKTVGTNSVPGTEDYNSTAGNIPGSSEAESEAGGLGANDLASLGSPWEAGIEPNPVQTAESSPISGGAMPETDSPVQNRLQQLDATGLIAMRYNASRQWPLDSNGYTVQLLVAPASQEGSLEEFLQFLEVISLVDDTYICFQPVGAGDDYRWLIYYGEFAGVSAARNLIQQMPPYITQHKPFAVNLADLNCSL